jgi:hypothetical protein
MMLDDRPITRLQESHRIESIEGGDSFFGVVSDICPMPKVSRCPHRVVIRSATPT